VRTPDYPLQTERLVLRPWREGDRDHYVAIRTDPDVAAYIPGHPLGSEVANEWFDRAVAKGTEAADGISIAVVDKATSAIVGTAGVFWHNLEHRQGELGYILSPGYVGQGYATEAAERLLEAAFCDLGAHRVFAELDPRNTASAKVCERLGMRFEGHLRGTYLEPDGTDSDSYLYAILAAEWRAQRGRS